MPETDTTDTDATTTDTPDVETLQASIKALEGALEAKKGSVRDLKGKLKAFETLGDPSEAAHAVEFYRKHKDTDPEKVEERFRTLADQKLAEAKKAHEAELAKLSGQILTLTVGHDVANALAAVGGIKEGYAPLIEQHISQRVAVREINGKPSTVVLDTDGEPLTAPGSLSPMPLATWIKEVVKPQFPDMFLGPNAGGGGSHKTQDGAGGGTTKTRQEWDAMTPQAQSKFAAEGGKVV